MRRATVGVVGLVLAGAAGCAGGQAPTFRFTPPQATRFPRNAAHVEIFPDAPTGPVHELGTLTMTYAKRHPFFIEVVDYPRGAVDLLVTEAAWRGCDAIGYVRTASADTITARCYAR